MDQKMPYIFTQPPFPSPPPPSSATADGPNPNNKVSPSLLLILIIVAIIFFISGLLHLLIRFLVKPSNRDPDEFDNVTALQGQLQQLFHLHDSGVDQTFIDSLPVFTYKSIMGVKNPFDCAVCLCEFEGEDRLRLLPRCSHAFHMDCIDTWLLSHSTCPLCRGSLLDFSEDSSSSPTVLVLESGRSEGSREVVNEPIDSSVQRVNSHLTSVHLDEESGLNLSDKSGEIDGKEEGIEKVVKIKLGKFKNGGGGGGGGENDKFDGRRCFSMGSFEYVMDENSSLQVFIRSQTSQKAAKKSNLPITSGHRPAMSECGGDSRRDFKGIEAYRSLEMNHIGGGYGGVGRESFSASKIWLRGKKEKPNLASAAAIEPSSRGSFSSPHRNVTGDDLKAGCDDQESQTCQNLDSQVVATKSPSFARRTLVWLMGLQQNKVVRSSFSTNV